MVIVYGHCPSVSASVRGHCPSVSASVRPFVRNFFLNDFSEPAEPISLKIHMTPPQIVGNKRLLK